MKRSVRALAGCLALLTSTAFAQEFPTRPIRFIVPFAAGGGGDITSRLVAQGMSKALGQPVVVDNKPGAAGQLGMNLVAKEPADGYTIVFGSSGPLTVLPHLSKVPYRPLEDFAAVGRLSVTDGVVIVNKDFPARTIPEFVDLLKKNPGKYDFGSSGTAGPSHLSGVFFQLATDTKLQHIGYKGDGPAITDLIGGTIPIVFTLLASAMPHIQAGNVRPLAAYGEHRSPLLPDLPTFVESGYPGLTYSAWFAVYAPAGTPAPVIEKLNAAVNVALADPAIASKLTSMGIVPSPSTPQALTRMTRDEYAKWERVIREGGITVDPS